MSMEDFKLIIKQIVLQEQENKRNKSLYDLDDWERLCWLVEQIINRRYRVGSGQYRRTVLAIRDLADKLNLI